MNPGAGEPGRWLLAQSGHADQASALLGITAASKYPGTVQRKAALEARGRGRGMKAEGGRENEEGGTSNIQHPTSNISTSNIQHPTSNAERARVRRDAGAPRKMRIVALLLANNARKMAGAAGLEPAIPAVTGQRPTN